MSDYHLGKSFLIIPDFVKSMMSALESGSAWDTTGVLASYLSSNFFYFLNDTVEATQTLIHMTRGFFGYANSINKLYNGPRDTGILGSQAIFLGSRELSEKEKPQYESLLFTNNIFSAAAENGIIPNWGLFPNPVPWLNNLQSGIIDNIQETIADLREQLDLESDLEEATEGDGALTDSQESGLRWSLWDLEQLLFELDGREPDLSEFLNISPESNSPFDLYSMTPMSDSAAFEDGSFPELDLTMPTYVTFSSSAIATIPVSTAIAKAFHASNVIVAIARSLLSTFVPSNVLAAVSHAVSGLVSKGLSLSIPKVSKLFSAVAMRGLTLPANYSLTTAGAGKAWSILVGYAPLIVIAATIIVIAVRSQKTNGPEIFIFGESEDNNINFGADKSYVRTKSVGRIETQAIIADEMERMIDRARNELYSKTYSSLTAVVTNSKRAVLYGYRVNPLNVATDIKKVPFLSQGQLDSLQSEVFNF